MILILQNIMYYLIMFRQLFQVTIQKVMPQTHIGMTTYSALKSSNHSPKYNSNLHNFSLIIVSSQFDFNLISIWFQGSALRKVGITANAKIPHKYIRGEWRENESRLRKGWTYCLHSEQKAKSNVSSTTCRSKTRRSLEQ